MISKNLYYLTFLFLLNLFPKPAKPNKLRLLKAEEYVTRTRDFPENQSIDMVQIK
jgi:hypothetical protein